jgi:hypothetical protein
LLERARFIARSQHKTLNEAFHEWLVQYTAQTGDRREYEALMQRLLYVRSGRSFSREERNSR